MIANLMQSYRLITLCYKDGKKVETFYLIIVQIGVSLRKSRGKTLLVSKNLYKKHHPLNIDNFFYLEPN